MKDVVIIGGGISGLSAAFFLKKQDYDVLLLEKENRVGGVIQSFQKDGYLLEAGPNTLMGGSTVVEEMIKVLDLEKERIFPPAHSKKRYIYYDKKLHKVSLFSPKIIYPLLKEPFIPKGKPDETVHEFFLRRLGKTITETYVDAFVTGIYAGDIYKLEMKSSFPKLWEWEQTYGSIVIPALSLTRDDNATGIYSFENGLETLPKALEKWLDKSIVKNIPVSQIKKEAQGFTIYTSSQTIQTRTVIFAAHPNPFFEFTVPYKGIKIFYLGYKKEHLSHSLNGFGFLIPSKENKKIRGMLWNSSLFENRAPQGSVLLTVMAELNSSYQVVKEEINMILNMVAEPSFIHEKDIEKAIPQYGIGHFQKKQNIENYLKNNPGFFITGNFLEGVSVVNCIENGQRVASQVSEFLTR